MAPDYDALDVAIKSWDYLNWAQLANSKYAFSSIKKEFFCEL
jgi:hypothetical protein